VDNYEIYIKDMLRKKLQTLDSIQCNIKYYIKNHKTLRDEGLLTITEFEQQTIGMNIILMSVESSIKTYLELLEK
jgi:hypothetical protein